MPGGVLHPVTAPGPPDPTELVTLARAVADEAAALLMSRHQQVKVVETKSSPTDVVTQMDRAAEELIRARIHDARPGDSILGEEGGQTGAGAEVRWVVDPLDGTVNYLYGLPDWSVSIAAEVDGAIVAGVVCAPLRRSTYAATAGGGAWLHSELMPVPRKLTCNDGVALAQALVGTGFSYQSAQRAVQGQIVGQLLPQVRDIRRAGSAALDLCAVAGGQLDAFYERGLNYWDVAAGGLVAREAGAVIGSLHGEQPSEELTLAAGPALFGVLHDALAALIDSTGAA